MNIKNTSKKKHNKKYYTPENVGEKGQMDVKYVPNECKSGVKIDFGHESVEMV